MKLVVLVMCVVGYGLSCPITVNIALSDGNDSKNGQSHKTGITSADHTHAHIDHTHSPRNHTHSPNDHTHPKQDFVAFSVGTRKAFRGTSATPIPMEVILYNSGGHFHTADNAFHAPMKGVYSFAFSGTAAQGKDMWMELKTKKQGGSKVPVAVAFDFASGSDYGGASSSVIIEMDAGETVSVYMTNGHQLYGMNSQYGPSTLFSGKLEHKLD